MPRTEADAQRAILDYLSLKKYHCWRNNTGALKTERGHFLRFGATGSPNIMCVIDGAFVGLEVKAQNGRLSPDQEALPTPQKASTTSCARLMMSKPSAYETSAPVARYCPAMKTAPTLRELWTHVMHYGDAHLDAEGNLQYWEHEGVRAYNIIRKRPVELC